MEIKDLWKFQKEKCIFLMKGINLREGELFIDAASLKSIASEYGTPTYVYSSHKLKENLNAYLSSVSLCNRWYLNITYFTIY